MKRLLCTLWISVLVVLLSANAFAAGFNAYEKDVLSALRSGVSVNGTTIQLPPQYLNQAENYLNTVDLTAEQANEIIGYIGHAKSLVREEAQKTGATSIAELKKSGKTLLNQVVSDVQKAAAVADLKVGYDKNTLVGTDASGKTVFSAAKPIKKTGGDWQPFGLIVSAGTLVVLAGGALWAARRFRLYEEA